jgi:MoaA/NifB/PqqE/SkfB family radical SAM enzyme
MRFGPGRHLDFEIFRRIIGELDKPDFIGLNYSGESIYYPKLIEAIALAKSTGAFTELVTAFSTIQKPLLQSIVESGLDRLAVSLHTMNPDQYRSIYRFGSLELLRQRIQDFLEMRSRAGSLTPRLDFCFVAMRENLDQLEPIAEYARSLGVTEISVHPVIGRHPVPYDFSVELLGNTLRNGFKHSVRTAVAGAVAAIPDVSINILNPDLDPSPGLSEVPGYFAPPLPAGARIYSCDQSPFESAHILASGDVVVCEVHDETSMGNLAEKGLREIWHGANYREFRRRYVAGGIPQCRTCVWKFAYHPSAWTSGINAEDGMSQQLLRGWHPSDGSGSIWSKKTALIVLANPGSHQRVTISGTLPNGKEGANSVSVTCNRLPLGVIQNDGREFLSFENSFHLPDEERYLYFEFVVETLFRPWLTGGSSDGRDLGFALHRIDVCS